MRLYKYLPAIIRLRDALASGFLDDQGTPEIAIPAGGLSSQYAGNAVAFNFRAAPTGIIDYVQYTILFKIKTGTAPWEDLETYDWQPTPGEQRIEAAFPLVDNGMETFSHFQVYVFGDTLMQQLLFTADSSVDQDDWTLRLQPIFERIFWMFENDAEVQHLLIRDLPQLINADTVNEQFLVYLAYLIGGSDRFPATLSTYRQRQFVLQLVNLWKIKGTFQSWRKVARLRNLGTINIRELYKANLYEHGDYSAEQSVTHPMKSARIDVLVCDTQCEAFTEYPIPSGESYSGTNITVGEAIRLIEEELNDFRPIHVLVRRLLETKVVEDVVAPTADSLAVTGRARFADVFSAMQDSLLVNQACIASCQVACQLCNEQVFDPIPFSGGVWRVKNYTSGSVPPALAAFYAASPFGAGSVTGAAPSDYHNAGFDDSDYTEVATPYGPSASFAAHSEMVARQEIYLAYVTGVVVEFEMVWVDFAEAYWNDTPITDLIMFGAEEAQSFDGGIGTIRVQVQESILRIGSNFIAVRAAGIHGDTTPQLNLEVRASFRKGANSSPLEGGPVSVTF